MICKDDDDGGEETMMRREMRRGRRVALRDDEWSSPTMRTVGNVDVLMRKDVEEENLLMMMAVKMTKVLKCRR